MLKATLTDFLSKKKLVQWKWTKLNASARIKNGSLTLKNSDTLSNFFAMTTRITESHKAILVGIWISTQNHIPDSSNQAISKLTQDCSLKTHYQKLWNIAQVVQLETMAQTLTKQATNSQQCFKSQQTLQDKHHRFRKPGGDCNLIYIELPVV